MEDSHVIDSVTEDFTAFHVAKDLAVVSECCKDILGPQEVKSAVEFSVEFSSSVIEDIYNIVMDISMPLETVFLIERII